MSEILKIVGTVVELIIDAVKNGDNDKAILERIAEPGGVGENLINAIRSRKDKFDDFFKNG